MLIEMIFPCVMSLLFSTCIVFLLEIITNAYNDGMKLINEEEKSIEQ